MNSLWLFLSIIAVGFVIYFGHIFIIQKALNPSGQEIQREEDPLVTAQRQKQKTEETWEQHKQMEEDPIITAQKQKQKTEETWEQQKRMMEEQKQRIRDMQHR